MIRDILLFLAVIGAGVGGWMFYRERGASSRAPMPMPGDDVATMPEPLPPMPLPEPVVPPPLPPALAPLVQLTIELSGNEDPALILAIIEQESDFNPRAYNPNDPNGGAWGLMQMLLPTARDMGYAGDGPGLFDPPTAIALGVAYIGWIRGYLASRGVGGDQAVIAAYNAGVGNVAKGYQNLGYVTSVNARREKWRAQLMGAIA